jgi:hypothetical protein
MGICGGSVTVDCNYEFVGVDAKVAITHWLYAKSNGRQSIRGKWRHRAASLGKCYSSSNLIGQMGQKFTTVRMPLFSARATMGYVSGENCNANLPKYHLPVGAGIFNL